MTTPPDVEDIYRLTELQEAMLVHSLQRRDADSGVLLVRAALRGELDVAQFRDAWQRTLARHAAARSSIHWQDLRHPVQVVAREVEVEIDYADWSSLPAAQRQQRLLEHEATMRERGLDVGMAPVMRWSLVRTGGLEHRLFWLCHHLLLDGWSSALLLGEVLDRCNGGDETAGIDESPAPRFRDWLVWLRQRDEVEPQAFWQSQRFRLATPIAAENWHERPRPGPLAVLERQLSVPTAALETVARRWQLTPASLLIGCWGLALAETTASPDVVFGLTAAGRSADFAGIERLVGMLANVVPLGLEIGRERSLEQWFKDAARAQHDVQRFERCSLGALLRAGGYVARRPMFDTLLTIANYPGVGARGERTAGTRQLELGEFASDVMSGYPFTLAIVPGRELRLRALYHAEALEQKTAEAIVARFDRIARTVVAGADGTVADVLAATPQRRASSVAGAAPTPRRKRSPTTSDASLSAVELQLVQIWLALLDVPDLGLDDTFFALGGNSILVPTMIERVRQDFGIELPLGAVFETPTVRALAKLIEGGDPERSWRCLVPIRAAGSKSPLYLMHYLEGSIGHYYNLANRLPPDQPVFGVQAPPAPLDSIEAMASRYLDEIRGRQPRGPYRLGGFCIGGMLAFEMARQLAAQDETVLPLILLDCVAPGPLFAKSNTVLPSAGTLTRMALADPQAFAGRVSKRLVRSVRRFGRASDDAAKPVELHDVRDMSSLPQAYVEPSICHFRAGRDYHPDPWDGDAILLRTDDERFGGDLGWSRWVRGNLEITLIPGSHVDTLKEPIVQETGRLVAAALDHPASSAFTPKS